MKAKQKFLGLCALLCGLAATAAEVPVTFNKEIAPLVFQNCATCHRPGQAGPFSLLNYADVKKHAKEIAAVTARRYMPPWLPESAPGEFIGDRRLTDAKIQLFQRWLDAGTPEGTAADLPALPTWPSDWQLGKPDLVVTMPKQYVLAADGHDVYRNFVIPAALTASRTVRAVEFRPDNRRIVHHAFVEIDYTGSAKALDGGDGAPGFPGMILPQGVRMPTGYSLSWQPGKMAMFEPPGFGWTLQPGQDLVLRTHLRTTGKPETLQAQVGFYFTDTAPTNVTYTISLSSLNIDIPAGVTNYPLESGFLLPVAVDLLNVLPHAHYLGKQLEGYALLPNGTSQRLIRIPDWDFNWQGDYRYTKPIHLPAGTTLQMRYSYDNSAANPRNPSQPPKPVRFGPQSSDEMGELWFQVRLNNAEDAKRLNAAYTEKHARVFADYAAFRLERDPRDAKARTDLGMYQFSHRKFAEALVTFQQAAKDDPNFDQPHYYIGYLYRLQNRIPEARTELETALRLNPKNAEAHGTLGFILLQAGDLASAEQHLSEALRLNPADQMAKRGLDKLQQSKAASPPGK